MGQQQGRGCAGLERVGLGSPISSDWKMGGNGVKEVLPQVYLDLSSEARMALGEATQRLKSSLIGL